MISIVYGCNHYESKTQENEKLVQSFMESLNDHDLDKLTSLFTENCLYEEVASGSIFSGKRKIAAYIESTLSGIPDSKFMILKLMANDTLGVVEWLWKGTNTVGWSDMGIAPSNKYFELRGISIMEIKDGHITHNRDYWDWNTFIKGISE